MIMRRKLIRTTFEKVEIKASKTWKTADGKRRRKTMTFWATINPWNTNAAGVPKTRDEILVGLRAKRDAWLAEAPPG